ncbi:MAG: hypothetical protein M0P31_15460 [Solirubrobacteraceae bacterium]|nr:hypothetical protein [Solirubrobacteraceae bacterium]
MATVGTHTFPVEDRLDGEFAAWAADRFDEDGAYVDAPDASVLWYFLDSDVDETNPVGVRIIDPDLRPDLPLDRDVQTVHGQTVRLRDALAQQRPAA